MDLTAPDAVPMSNDADPMQVERGFDTGLKAYADNPGQTGGGEEDLDIYESDVAGEDAQVETQPAEASQAVEPEDVVRWRNQYRDSQIQMRRLEAQYKREMQDLQAKSQRNPMQQQLDNVLRYPGMQAKLAEFITQIQQDPNFDPGTPSDAIRDVGLRQEFEQIKPLINEFQEIAEALRYEKAESQVNHIHEDLKSQYPDVFESNPDFFQEIARETLERFGDDPTPDNIRYVAYEKILKELPKATQRAAGQIARAMAAQPPGSRIVNGAAAKAASPPGPQKNYAKMTWREIEQDALGDLYGAT